MATPPDTPPRSRKLEKRVRKFEQRVVEEIELVDTKSARAAVKRERFVELRAAAMWLGLWALLAAASLYGRGLWPSDETRMLGIAWEMWARGNFLVPYLNDEAVLQPPLFFWLVQAWWAVFGTVGDSVRLVAPLGAFASLFVVQRLARLLWPEEKQLARYVPLLLLGMFAFALMMGLAVPDMWLLCFVLIALWALLIRWRRRDMRAWLLLALALGCGALTSGFVIFIYVLPVALLAPWWARTPRPEWKHWYADVLKATAVALVLFGVWLALAAKSEGGPYAVRLLSHTQIGLPLDLFVRQQPWWWYAWVAPLVFLPWSVLPLAWMRLWYIRREPLDTGFVFCLVWAVSSLLLLSLFPLKQPQYLLPLVPAGALLACRLLFADALRTVYQDKSFAGMAVPLIILGGVLMVLPRLPRVEYLPALLWAQSPWLGVGIMAVGIASAWLPFKDVRRRVFDIVVLSALLVVSVLFGVASRFDKFYPLDDVGQVLAAAQAHAQPVAHVGEYHGEFHFAGRLHAPLTVVEPARVDDWATAHPDGVIVTYTDRWQPRALGRTAPLFEAGFRDSRIQILPAQ